jgi:putative nucleotidyltransferase with HDIG domain
MRKSYQVIGFLDRYSEVRRVMDVANQYIEISVSLLKRFSKTLQFDIYVKRSDKAFTKIFKSGDLIDWERVKLYTDKGIKTFYCHYSDYDLYGLYVERAGHELSLKGSNLKQSETLDIMKEIVQYTYQELVIKTSASARLIEVASTMVSSCIESLNKDPKTLVRLLNLMGHQPYLVRHSVAVSMFAVMLAKQAGIESDSNLKIIGLGGLLHDVGEGQLNFDPEQFEVLSPEQRKMLWRHPELGKQLLDGIKGLRSEVLQIVIQHHEQPNGHGYPNALKSGDIYYPAKIVAIADSFASLLAKRSYRDAFTVEKAILCMREHQGKYDRALMEHLNDLFIKKVAAA